MACTLQGEQTYHTFLGTAPTKPQLPKQLLGFEYVDDGGHPDDSHRWTLDSWNDLLLLANNVHKEKLVNLLQEHWLENQKATERYQSALENDAPLAEWLQYGYRQDSYNWLHEMIEHHSLIFRDEHKTRYIGYYRHDSHCGGPEEGGWWYSTDTLTSWTSEVCTFDMADQLAQAMTEKLKSTHRGSYSVIDTIPHQVDQQRPRYE